jgi:hypothetical protein
MRGGIMRTCHCGCGEPLAKLNQRFFKPSHRLKWAKKLSDRYVLPVWSYKNCLYCGGLLILFPATRSRKVCDSPVCQQAKKDERIRLSIETKRRNKEIERAMTKETPYLSTREWWQRDLRERVREVAGL